MEIESLDTIGINVNNLDEAIKRFSEVLGLEFVKPMGGAPKKNVKPGTNESFEGARLNIAVDKTNYLVLAESHPPVGKEGLRCIHFKVADMEICKKELNQKGIPILSEVEEQGFKEAVFNLMGVRIALVEYTAPSMADILLKRHLKPKK